MDIWSTIWRLVCQPTMAMTIKGSTSTTNGTGPLVLSIGPTYNFISSRKNLKMRRVLRYHVRAGPFCDAPAIRLQDGNLPLSSLCVAPSYNLDPDHPPFSTRRIFLPPCHYKNPHLPNFNFLPHDNLIALLFPSYRHSIVDETLQIASLVSSRK